MNLRRFVLAGVALAAMGVMALPVMAQNAPPPPKLSPAFERAILNEMAPATRAEVQKRAASGGNTVQGVIATMLLNDASMVKGNTGAVTVIAIDFVRGVVVVQTAPNQYQPVRFDPKTLKVLT